VVGGQKAPRRVEDHGSAPTGAAAVTAASSQAASAGGGLFGQPHASHLGAGFPPTK
jgi:hypothetical protein